ncbi:MAG: VWA domain-containing protein [Kofleriaceae bacterium]
MTGLWTSIMSLTFANPGALWAAAIAPVAVAALHIYDHDRRRILTERLGELPVIRNVIATASPRRRVVKDALIALGSALIMVAIARPQLEGKRKVELRGLDVAIAVDVSKSMLVDDVGPTPAMTRARLPTSRLERARELAERVIEQLPGDRIAPVVFAGAASHFPLTEDYEVAARFLRDLGPGDLPQGSNLPNVLRTSRCLLRPDVDEDCAEIGRRLHGGDPLHGESLDPQPDPGRDDAEIVEKVERGKAIVIFTDGGEHDAEAVREIAAARKLGIAVLFVGIGTEQGGVVYDIDPWGGQRTTVPKKLPDGTAVRSRREDAEMRELAEIGGDAARYIIASDIGDVDPRPIVEALRAVTRGLATKQVTDMKDVFEPFLFAGFMLLVIEVAIGTRRRRKYPEAR